MEVTLDGDKIKSINFVGGCPGNTMGVASLVIGMAISEVTERLDGIMCGARGTSCPNELVKALKSIKE